MNMKVLVLTLLFVIGFSYAKPIQPKKQILIINSYHKGFQWSDELINGVEIALGTTHNVETTILYMDSKRISSLKYYKKLKDLYKVQLQNRKYDLVLLVDKVAYNFALKNYDELFTNERLVFSGIEQFDPKEVEKYGLKDKTSGVMEKRAIGDIINIIDKMMPDLKKLHIINDYSVNGDDTDVFIQNAISKINNKFKINYIRYSDIETLKKKFAINKKDEAIFFIRFYNSKAGVFYKNYEIADMIDSFNLPTFSTDSLFIEKGSLGGRLVQIEEIGKTTGNLLLRLLRDENQEPIIKVDRNYSHIFDYEKVKKFNLDPTILDKKISYVNTPLSFLDKNRDFVNIVFIFSPILLLLIVVLVYNLQLQIKNAKNQEFIIQQSKLAEIGEIISSIAHQWKEPLIEISTLVQEYVGSEKKTKEEDKKYLDDVMFQIYYMTDTINDFQDFIKPSSKKTSFNIKDAIVKMMNIVEHNIKYNYIDININIKDDAKLIVSGYHNELMQSLLNIVNNAKDTILKQKELNKKFKGQINIDIFNSGNYVQIEINDNGGGIKEKDIKKIFEPYYTTKEKGHGIGLYMTKIIIEDKMSGLVDVTNKNDGANFIIKLELDNENISS
ncbi:sensor histidine kinase [Poseidonibacter lekithochrous]|uniref:sensor histidine kinase n=1 Tax=Poseidonibacter lekithochrous TaxID=1904463 RepID=UPI0009FA7019|nr:ATP-binding protein [Poseidonibacter lekithochrous]QKJ23225.1 two-component system sensor histidine kinase [Poseidonibacter lekithochrous]